MGGAVGLPPVSLSTGPAIAGGPTESGGVVTGDFIVGKETWQDRLAVILPIMLVGGGLWIASRYL